MLTSILIICASLCLLALAVMIVYLTFGVFPRIRNTISSLHQTIDGEVKPLLEEIKGTVQTVNENVSGISEQVETLNTEHIQPIAGDIKQVTEKINSSVAMVEETIGKATEFSNETIGKAKFYREKLFEPAVEIVSFWRGLKVGGAVFANRLSEIKKMKKGGGEKDER